MARKQAWRARPRSYIRHTLKSYMDSTGSTVVGVGVFFGVLIITFVVCFVKTHRATFDHIEHGREHALSRQDKRDETQERRDQHEHERALAKQKRELELKDREHQRSQRTSAHTETDKEHHRATQDKADVHHAELVELLKIRHTHETPSHSSATHNGGSFFGAHDIPTYSTLPNHSQPHQTVHAHPAPHHASTWGHPIHPIPTFQPHQSVTHGGSHSIPNHHWIRL
jgi:hypothetical protein